MLGQEEVKAALDTVRQVEQLLREQLAGKVGNMMAVVLHGSSWVCNIYR